MAAKQNNDELFAESSRGATSALTFFGFIISFVLFFGGMVVFSYGFGPELSPEQGLITYAGGLAASFLGVIVAFAVIPAIEKK